MNYLIMMIAVMLLTSCSITKGYEESKDYTTKIVAYSGAVLFIRAPIDVTADRDSDSATTARQTVSPTTRLAASQAQGASTAQSRLGTGLQAIDDVRNRLLNDNSTTTRDSNNPVDNSRPVNNTTTPVAVPVNTTPGTTVTKDVTTTQTVKERKIIVDLEPYEDRSFAWLPETGAHYGGPIKLVFPGCDNETLNVPDAKVSHGADGNSKNYHQTYYFCGTDFEPGTSENLNNRASVFTTPGCTSATVEIYTMK